MTLEILNRSKVAVPRQFLVRFLAQAERLLLKRLTAKQTQFLRDKTLLIVFVSKSEARRLNRQFRGKDYPTDVLSFSPSEPDSMGELVMNPHVLKRQAKDHELSYREEVAYMCLHGVLHLLGFDHEKSQTEARRMFRLQDEVFWSILET